MIYNTGETDESLKMEYNPDGSPLRNLQLRMLDMLLYLHNICENIGVSYRIDGGTVLGAIRHHGFIPWDDDIDIVLNLNDWKKLCKYLEENPHSQYVLQTHKTDNGHYCEWAKLRDTKSAYYQPGSISELNEFRGAQIDIFVFEKSTSTVFMRWAKKLEQINEGRFIGRNKIVAHSMFLINNCFIYPLFRFVANIFCHGDYWTHSYGAPWLIKFPTKLILPHKIMKFEGFDIWGPADPIGLCETIYGNNWKLLPPKEKRSTHSQAIEVWS